MNGTCKNIARLPPLLAAFARATDYDTALKIGAAWGGTKRSIPADPKEGCALAQIVGLEAARKIASHLYRDRRLASVMRFDIPSLRLINKELLKEQILASVGTTRQIALGLRCSERYVRMVKNG